MVLPDMPPMEDMKNFGLDVKDQKFKSHVVPKDITAWSDFDQDKYAEAQWHRRLNGEWWIIKGQPFYFPGGCLPFFDFWTMEGGKTPKFRMEALEFFVFWYLYVERDPCLFGMYDMKCRRLGDTEKVMYIIWERTTRYKNVSAGLQSYTDKQALKNFTRLARGS